MEHQIDLLLPGGNIGDVVLDGLVLPDGATECLARFGVIHRLFEHRVDGAETLGANQDALVVERRQQHVPRVVRLPEEQVVVIGPSILINAGL